MGPWLIPSSAPRNAAWGSIGWVCVWGGTITTTACRHISHHVHRLLVYVHTLSHTTKNVGVNIVALKERRAQNKSMLRYNSTVNSGIYEAHPFFCLALWMVWVIQFVYILNLSYKTSHFCKVVQGLAMMQQPCCIASRVYVHVHMCTMLGCGR